MPVTYKKIASVTVASAQASIDITSIPATYDDLVLHLSLRTTRAATDDDVYIRFNGSSTNYSQRILQGNGSTAISSTQTAIQVLTDAANNTASTFGSGYVYIPSYAGSTNKSVSFDHASEDNSASNAYIRLSAGLWSNTAAITQITMASVNGANIAANSTATLYGVKRS